MKKRILVLGLAAVLGINGAGVSSVFAAKKDKVEITNVSYDPTRELYEQYNKIFAEHWKEESGQEVEITQCIHQRLSFWYVKEIQKGLRTGMTW